MRTVFACTVLLSGMLLAACGGSSSSPSSPSASVTPPVVPQAPDDALVPRTRYALNNQCFAILAVDADRYLVRGTDGYSATAEALESATAFYFKPAALGEYLLYDSSGDVVELVSATGPVASGQPAPVPLPNASSNAIFTALTVADTTDYPPKPTYDVEMTAASIAAYRAFTDPEIEATTYTLGTADGRRLAIDAGDALVAAAPADDNSERFAVRALQSGSCAEFPEASDNTRGETFSGRTADGRVLGMADVHVHISATTFLGLAEWGSPFHPLGVVHALGDCVPYHGQQGSEDFIGAGFQDDTDGHATTGWPLFTEWPTAESLSHEAIYWKWLERAWKAGLRIAVNDVVENQTLCELQRNARREPDFDCNPMNNAADQTASMYALQDYIDAQYGGRGEGWLQIVHDPAEARSVIEDGRLAMVLGIEISNLLNCQLTYNNPGRTQQPFEETGNLQDGGVTYGCKSTETGADDEILTQLQRLWGLGVRQIISIHEFDNAFGGNGIFATGLLNTGNRENSGGTPSGEPGNPFSGDQPPAETPTGEFWTTYSCPEEGGLGTDGQPFSGYLWSDSGGKTQDFNRPPACTYTGQGGRPGGASPCYPDKPQCNARWMTPIGTYFYSKIMEMGFIFDFDHMELEMKTQALEIAEAQPIAYPFVSTHGTFGGTSIDQARRTLQNGGFLYPSNGSSKGFLEDMLETRTEHAVAMDAAGQEQLLFGFGFGTDTNGLSSQTRARNSDAVAANPITYPYTLFQGGVWDEATLSDFANIAGVAFDQPAVLDPNGFGRNWHIDMDGNAHYGMLSGFVQEIAVDGSAEDLKDLFNSAEVFLRTWTRTLDAATAIAGNPDGKVIIPPGVLRPAPVEPAPVPGPPN